MVKLTNLSSKGLLSLPNLTSPFKVKLGKQPASNFDCRFNKEHFLLFLVLKKDSFLLDLLIPTLGEGEQGMSKMELISIAVGAVVVAALIVGIFVVRKCR